VNFTLQPTEAAQLRFGYNITMDQPSFIALRASGELGVRTTGSGTPTWDGFTTESGNPDLRPMISENTDISLEWYPSRSATAHMSLFHKSIQNWIVYGGVNQLVPVHYVLPTDQTVIERAQSSNYSNATDAATIKGVEIGGRKFFDRLPKPFDGFGVEANYTYIDSKNPGDQYFDINGVQHSDAPVQGLSRNNYNVTAMYERGPLSVRIAYSWRSQYLMTTNGNGTNGDYTFYSAPGVGTFTDINLPVYSDSYGQLDFGTTYRPSDHLALSLELSNLTNEIAKTLQGGYPNGSKYPRSWFMSDRRANLSVRYNF
jgi:TonB-dependent receptor